MRIIDGFYRCYHSLRFVGNRLVMRLNSRVDPDVVQSWKNQFEDILDYPGEFFLCTALPEEVDEPTIAHLPRLVMDFNRKDYARLRKLVDVINES